MEKNNSTQLKNCLYNAEALKLIDFLFVDKKRGCFRTIRPIDVILACKILDTNVIDDLYEHIECGLIITKDMYIEDIESRETCFTVSTFGQDFYNILLI